MQYKNKHNKQKCKKVYKIKIELLLLYENAYCVPILSYHTACYGTKAQVVAKMVEIEWRTGIIPCLKRYIFEYKTVIIPHDLYLLCSIFYFQFRRPNLSEYNCIFVR